ncbi:MAG: immune inhibitor A [Thermoleophilia bacterium]
MRKVVLGVALAALLSFLIAAPAGAVPANEVLIAKNLERLGLIPPYATAEMKSATVGALDVQGPQYPNKAPVAGAKSTTRSLAKGISNRSASLKSGSTYVAKTLVLLVEFGDDPWPAGSSAPTGPNLTGPLHGNIPAPEAGDNATFWLGDFSAGQFDQMLFGNSYTIYGEGASGGLVARGTSTDTMRNYYLEQSHGTYTVDGDIAQWVQLDMPESWYGADSVPWASTDDLNGPVWRVARDALVKFAEQNPGFDFSQYDKENPWGLTGDNYFQPDGYIDHLILIHAGADESAGGGSEGPDAIWAHSWDIYENLSGGPGNGAGMLIPGTEGQGPQGLGIWAFNYTINPEDGAIGVFSHEFGHDLGLDDQYDYASETTGDATSGFWTIMASGSWLGSTWGLGTKPAPFNADDKVNLGFIKPKTVKRNKTATVTLQAAATGNSNQTSVKIALPDASHPVPLSGKDGSKEWYSTLGNNLDVTLATTSPIRIAAGADLTFRTWYEIEPGYDFGYVDISDDGGATWTTLEVFSDIDTYNWASTVRVDLAEYEGSNALFRFRYTTDYSVVGRGWEVTDIAVGGSVIPEGSFTSHGWVRTDGSYTIKSTRYYIAEYRTHHGFDAALTKCYEWNRDGVNLVDFYTYNTGLHLIYRDTFYDDNDVASHIGYGARMVVDAHPKPDKVSYDGTNGYWRPRIQVRDAAFSLKKTASQRIYFTDYDAGEQVGTKTAPGETAQPWFNDAWTYWYTATPEAGVKIPKLGVRIKVVSQKSTTMKIWIDNKK